MNCLRAPFVFPLLLALAAPVPGQTAVRLVQVPAVVRLPAAAGENLLLEVELDGEVDAVWLAAVADAEPRVPLQLAAARRYQVNLADARVAALLPAGSDQGQLFVFAQLREHTTQSAAIGWVRSAGTTGTPGVTCLARSSDGTTTVGSSWRRTWLDAARLQRIEVRGAAGAQDVVEARLGDVRVPLSRQAGGDGWVLDATQLGPERVAAHTVLEVEVRRGAAIDRCAFELVPERLALPQATASFVVKQRRTGEVPGSRGWLRLSIDDITLGRVLVRMSTATGDEVVAQRAVTEREAVEFALAGERYVLVVDALVNLLIGEDHAEFSVRAAAGYRADRILLLLQAVAASEHTFVREGRDYDGAAAHLFLQAKASGPAGRKLSLDQFVDDVASRSSKTGEAYRVRRGDGSEIPMQQWLREELGRIDARAGARDAAEPRRH